MAKQPEAALEAEVVAPPGEELAATLAPRAEPALSEPLVRVYLSKRSRYARFRDHQTGLIVTKTPQTVPSRRVSHVCRLSLDVIVEPVEPAKES